MLEEIPKVLDARWRLPEAFSEKEWWFGYLHAPDTGVYLSWSCVRTWYMERFRCWFVDLDGEQTEIIDRPLFFERPREGDRMDLRAGGTPSVRYGAEGQNGLRLRIEGGKWDVDLALTPSPRPFARTEDQFEAWYGVRAHFHNRARGIVRVGEHTRGIDTVRCYTDHCWGRVPSRTGWHWLAAQDERVAIDSLVNYGPYGQRYTQVFVDGRWHVLPDDVVFDVDRRDSRRPWRVLSPDVELEARPLRVHRDHVRVPVLVDLHHDEHVVEVTGRVRVDGRWVDVGRLVGVTEQHHGTW